MKYALTSIRKALLKLGFENEKLFSSAINELECLHELLFKSEGKKRKLNTFYIKTLQYNNLVIFFWLIAKKNFFFDEDDED